jgi:hypothetical protein
MRVLWRVYGALARVSKSLDSYRRIEVGGSRGTRGVQIQESPCDYLTVADRWKAEEANVERAYTEQAVKRVECRDRRIG